MGPEIPPSIPDYALKRQIGSGAYGDVWLGQNHVTGTWHAVKIVRRQSGASDKLFDREFKGIQNYEPVSRSDSTLIPILHVARNDREDSFYYVMELADDTSAPVENKRDLPLYEANYTPRTLASDLASRKCLPPAECIELGLFLTSALAALHSKGLIHRDIKPSNIIFINKQPKLADIGLVESADATMSLVGTAGYVAPEGPFSPQADLYSLGKVLYESATGKDRQRFPEPPTSLDTAKDSMLWAELNEIILKACKFDAADRYESAEAMRKDLLLLHAGHSVRHLRIIENRFRVLARVAALIALAGALSLLAYLYQRGQSLRFQKLVEESRINIVQVNISQGLDRMNKGDFSRSLLWFTKALQINHNQPTRTANARLRIDIIRREFPKPVAAGMHEGPILYAEFSPNGRFIVTASEDSTARVWNAETSDLVFPPVTLAGLVRRAVFSPDGSKLATINTDFTAGEFTANIWDARTGKNLVKSLRHKDEVNYISFSPDGKKVVTASKDYTAVIWDAETGLPLTPPLKHTGAIYSATFSPDGKFIVTASGDRTARIWNAETAQRVGRSLIHGNEVNRALFSPNGKRILTISDDGTARVWNAKTGEPVVRPLRNAGSVQAASYSPDGKRLVTAGGVHGATGAARVWDAETGDLISTVSSQENWIASACFSADGRWILLNADGAARVYDAETGVAISPMLRHGEPLTSVTFGKDGRRILTAGKDGSWRIWDLAGERFISASAEFPHTISHTEFDRKGERVLVCERVSQFPTNAPNKCFIMDLARFGDTNHFIQHQNLLVAKFSPDGGFFVTSSIDGTARIWNTTNCEPVGPILPGFSEATFSPDGARILTGRNRVRATDYFDGLIWSTLDWKQITIPLQHISPFQAAVFSPDGALLATASKWEQKPFSELRIWNARSGKPISPRLRRQGNISSLHFSPDSGFLLTASSSIDDQKPCSAEIWDVRKGKYVFSFVHSDGVAEAQFSPDGQCVVTSSEDCTARIWSARTGAPVGRVMRHNRTVVEAKFSPDGHRIVTASHDGTARIWDAATGEPLSPPLPCGGMVRSVCFSPQGDKILAGSGDFGSSGQIHLWNLHENNYPLDDLVQFAQVLSGNRVDETGASVPLAASELFSKWTDLKRKHPEDFTVTPASKFLWHKTQAEVALSAKNIFAAQFHLNQCLEFRPHDKEVLDKLSLLKNHDTAAEH
jgi:WD40 repeat protein/serine/threonine protein kinase